MYFACNWVISLETSTYLCDAIRKATQFGFDMRRLATNAEDSDGFVTEVYGISVRSEGSLTMFIEEIGYAAGLSYWQPISKEVYLEGSQADADEMATNLNLREFWHTCSLHNEGVRKWGAATKPEDMSSQRRQQYQLQVEELHLSKNLSGNLRHHGIITIGDLLDAWERGSGFLSAIPGIDELSIQEIERKLKDHNRWLKP